MVNHEIADHRALVYHVAHRMRVGKPACVELDDLVQAGMLGLIEASERFEPGAGASFAGFASLRIQGAMLDELRSNDWLSRRERRFRRQADDAILRLQHRHLRAPTDAEVAAELGVTPLAYVQLRPAEAEAAPSSLNEIMSEEVDLQASPAHHILRSLESSTADISNEPSSVLQQLQMQAALMSAIAALPERERSALEMHYGRDLNLKTIGARLGVCESRVSQLISRAVARLHDQLADWRTDRAPGAALGSQASVMPAAC